jgi:hypothetical protein
MNRSANDERDSPTSQAVMQVLQRQWNPTFSHHSYGFRVPVPQVSTGVMVYRAAG